MVDMAAISAAVTSLKAATDIAKSFMQLKSASEIQSKVIELQTVILSAQSSALAAQSDQFSLLEKIREFEKKVADLEAWEAEKKRYALKDLAPGSAAYILKEEARDGEPIHCICANCYQDGKKSILHLTKDYAGMAQIKCSRCNAEMSCWAENSDFPIPLR